MLFAFEELTFVRSRGVLRSVNKKRIPGLSQLFPHLLEHLAVAFPIPQLMIKLAVSRQSVSEVSQSQITCLELSLYSGTDTTQHHSTDFHLTCLFLV